MGWSFPPIAPENSETGTIKSIQCRPQLRGSDAVPLTTGSWGIPLRYLEVVGTLREPT